MSRIRLRKDALAWREVDGEVIAVDLKRSTYLSIRGSGMLLWIALADGATSTTLTELITSNFRVEEHRARHDVDAFIADLAERELIDELAP
jgi:Coenzyme PQQ synthesis protein D (PqqD)